jgi:hypothetical protein
VAVTLNLPCFGSPERAFLELAGPPPVPDRDAAGPRQGHVSPPGTEVIIAFGNGIDTPRAWQRRQEMNGRGPALLTGRRQEGLFKTIAFRATPMS